MSVLNRYLYYTPEILLATGGSNEVLPNEYLRKERVQGGSVIFWKKIGLIGRS